MIDQILKLYSDGIISDGAMSMEFIINHLGPMSDEELAKTMHKHVRTIKRYRSELTKLPSVSLYVNNKTLTNKEELKTNLETSIFDQIATILDKFDKVHFTRSVAKVFMSNQIEFNSVALEYIIKYSLKHARNFKPYFLKCLVEMWDEAIDKTKEVKEIPGAIESIAIVGDTPPERPNTDQDAERVWEQIKPEIVKQSPKATAEMIKRMVPVNKKDSTLYLAVESDFAREWILHKVGNLFDAAFINICMSYEIILDQDISIKIA
jgi:hypothetical protein